MIALSFLIRLTNIFLILILSNIVMLLNAADLNPVVNIIIITLLILSFIRYNVVPAKKKNDTKRLSIMLGGYKLLTDSFAVIIVQTILYIYLFTYHRALISLLPFMINLLVGTAVAAILILNGLIRILTTSLQLGIVMRIILLLTWWIPIVNVIIFWKCCRIVRREYMFEISKIELNDERKDSDVCKTKYPILLVHGIFWRDWQLFNYWGRIPKELRRNGATIYFGNQHSAASMDMCANEIKRQILNIIQKDNCEKVNIIAHSKGGLDVRYTISCLGMDKHVASLTTINTPHRGCKFLDKLLKLIPDGAVRVIAKRYDAVYKKLGDEKPDFYSGIYDLTSSRCEEFNQKVQDKDGVIYQSVTSKMSSIFSAGFPLNIGYAYIHLIDGENDGLVTVESSKWGEVLNCYCTKGKRGISHGDIIDMMRENIQDFDVRECYVDIVKKLKDMNL